MRRSPPPVALDPGPAFVTARSCGRRRRASSPARTPGWGGSLAVIHSAASTGAESGCDSSEGTSEAAGTPGFAGDRETGRRHDLVLAGERGRGGPGEGDAALARRITARIPLAPLDRAATCTGPRIRRFAGHLWPSDHRPQVPSEEPHPAGSSSRPQRVGVPLGLAQSPISSVRLPLSG